VGKQEFAQMLEGIINDSETAGRVASGDFSDMADGELTEAEHALLTAAAGDLDGDVSGFGDNFLKLGDIDGKGWKVDNIQGNIEVEWSYNVRRAFNYAKIKDF
jgi:hypothetical protein